MTDKITISTFQLFEMFPDAEAARKYLEATMWPHGPVCPECGCLDRITTRKSGYYRCNPCKLDFTIRTGTIFGRSHIPLHKWIYAMYLLMTARKGISSLQLSKEIGIAQSSAWFMLHRIREACGPGLNKKLRGIIEIDETFVGGKEANKHEHKKLKAGRGTVGKTPVLGMRERGGRTVATPIANTDAGTVQAEIHRHVEVGSTLHTDEAGAYAGIGDMFFDHDTVNHSEGEFVRNGVTTNGIESVFSVLKRGLIGVYHHASPKHLARYVDEFTFRLNDGAVKRHTLDRLDSLVQGTNGRRITYEELTA